MLTISSEKKNRKHMHTHTKKNNNFNVFNESNTMKQLISELGTRNNSLVISTGSQQSDEICINLCWASKLISTR